MRWTPLLGLLTLGCGSDELPSQYAPFTNVPGNNQTDAKYEGARRDWVGELSVDEGSVDGAFTVTAGLTGGDEEFEVRSRLGTYDAPEIPKEKGQEPLPPETPNGLNLVGMLDGVKNGQISLEEDGVTGDISLAFSDDDGLVYLTEVAGSSQLTELILGGNFVRQGESLGTAPAGETELTLYTVQVTTDDGVVEAYPGFPIEITVQNNRYQFVLLANWQRTFSVGQNCPIDERLAYEMVRISEEQGFDEKVAAEGILRSENDTIDGGGCVVIAQ